MSWYPENGASFTLRVSLCLGAPMYSGLAAPFWVPTLDLWKVLPKSTISRESYCCSGLTVAAAH